MKRISSEAVSELTTPGIELVESGYGTYGLGHLKIHFWDHSTKLRIGKFCSLADEIHIFLGGNHNLARISTYPFGIEEELIGPRPGHPLSNGDIEIGNDVWIGSHVSIMSGVKIGDGAVVAAFSHVVKDVEPYEVVGGNPARHIKFRFSQEQIEKLLAESWWNWPLDQIKEKRDYLTSEII